MAMAMIIPAAGASAATNGVPDGYHWMAATGHDDEYIADDQCWEAGQGHFRLYWYADNNLEDLMLYACTSVSNLCEFRMYTWIQSVGCAGNPLPGYSQNDIFSSFSLVQLDSGWCLRAYQDTQYRGAYKQWSRTQSVNDLSDAWNDKISSFKPVSPSTAGC